MKDIKETEMHCPRVDCKNHIKGGVGHTKWYIKFSAYTTKRLKTRIQRFRCKHCGKTFSTQTFSIDYYVHKTIDYKEIEKLNTSIEKIGDIARLKKVSYCVIRNRLERISRQHIGFDSKNKRYCSNKIKPALKEVYGKGSNAERFIISCLKNEYENISCNIFYTKRYFLSFEQVEEIVRSIWLQEYKADGVFVPQFIAG